MSLLFSRWRGRSPGLTKRGDKQRAGRHRRSLALEAMESRTLMTGTITPLVNPAPAGSGTMMLETNGDVIVEGGGVSQNYYQLTPDSSGNYADGTWTQLSSSATQRLYYGSVVLPNGEIMIQGGEYSGPAGQENDNPTGEIYNPATNVWTSVAPFPEDNFGDDDLINLGNGNVLAGYLIGPQTFIYTPSTNTWTQTGTKLNNDRSDEEGFVRLPDGSLLDYEIEGSINANVGHAERYIPSTGQWVDAGIVPELLSTEAVGEELGAGLLLPDGRVFQIGGNNNTAYYTPSTNTWTAGPNMPNGYAGDDAPATELANGNILMAVDTPLFQGPTHVFEFNPTTNVYTDISSEFPTNYLDGPAYVDRTLNLPNGQVLYGNGSGNMLLYTPDPTLPVIKSNIPAIKSISENASGSFTLTGTGINGNNDGSVYGDDVEMSTNFPIVSFTSSTGVVSYATTSGFNYAVEQGSTPLSTQFTLPVGLAKGTYQVKVIANGVASSPFSLAIPTKLNDPAPTFTAAATATPNPVFTTSTQLTSLGADTAGESTLTYTWSTTSAPSGVQLPTFAINGTNAAKNDTVTFKAVGTYTFRVTATNQAGLSTSSSVTVNVDPALTTLALSPTSLQLLPNQTEQFNVASGLDQFGSDITASSLTWAVTSGGGKVTSSGLYTAPATGTLATVTVSSGKVKQSATVYVLSTPWTQTDVGSPTTAGDAADNGTGQFTLLGAGTGISGNSDQFQFAYLGLTGNSTIEAQVSSVQNTNGAAEAGVMFRNDTSAGAMNVAVTITPASGLVFSYRTTNGGNTTIVSTPRVVAGDYVKIVRVGNGFTGYYSTNGTTWTQVGSVSVAMASNADAGLVATSNNTSALNTSVLSKVLADSTPYVVTTASANPSPVTTTQTTLSVLGGDNAGESSLTYTWSTTVSVAGAIAPTFATNGTNASKNDVVTFTKAGTYTFQVLIANSLGYSTTSSVTVTVVPTQTTVQLTPLTATVPEGQSQQFVAAVYDQFGIKLAKQPLFTYSMLAGGVGGRVSSTGYYTAPTNQTGIDYLNVTGAGTAAIAKITVTAGTSTNPVVTKSGSGSVATVGTVTAGWGSDSATLVTAADGLRLLPTGRQVDLPWAGIHTLTVALSQAEPLAASDVKVSGITVANYGPVTVTPVAGSTTTYLITLAQAITSADRVTVTIGNSGVTTYTRRLDVLPGDVNDDGVVDSTDVSLASGYLLTTYIGADINGDGVVSSKSVKAIQLLNGTTLPAVG